MTWYADEIFLRATPAALALVAASQQLRDHSFHIQSLAGHHWFRDEIRHALPDEGLLVIRPVCDALSQEAEWHETILDWAALDSDPTAHHFLSDKARKDLVEYLDGEPAPPPSFRQACATLAHQLGQTAIYYSCGMWGGDIEHEYCLVYEPTESVFLTQRSRPIPTEATTP